MDSQSWHSDFSGMESARFLQGAVLDFSRRLLRACEVELSEGIPKPTPKISPKLPAGSLKILSPELSITVVS